MSGAAATTRRLLGELEEAGIRLGLEAMERLLEALGSPHLRLPHVLVAGTNGKGSTAAQLHALLSAAGYRCGLYTSPHLEDVRERIRIDGRAISTPALATALQRVVAVAEAELGARPTYFEALTAVAFDVFAEETDIAIMEVGLGGRLDATNVGQPVLSLITEIGLDHMELLGRSEVEIAREKAGIMRPHRRVLTAATSKAVGELEIAARRIGAHFEDVLETTSVGGRSAGRIEVVTEEAAYTIELDLRGEHQRRNLVLAVRAAEALRAEGWHRISAQAIAAGVSGCRWPGRLERVAIEDGREVLLDAAHNPQGASMLARYLARNPSRDCLLFGVLADKDVETVLPALAAVADRVVLTAPGSPRAMSPTALEALVVGTEVAVEADVAAALDRALAGDERRVVVCGSIYLVGEVRQLLRQRFGRPPAAVDLDLTGG